MRVGLREANQHFSRLMKAVRAGHEVVLTDRGRPVVLLKPLARDPDEDVTIRNLEALGLLRPAVRRTPMRPFRPRRVRGEPPSRTLREERDSS